jgi:hypothetical protein
MSHPPQTIFSFEERSAQNERHQKPDQVPSAVYQSKPHSQLDSFGAAILCVFWLGLPIVTIGTFITGFENSVPAANFGLLR